MVFHFSIQSLLQNVNVKQFLKNLPALHYFLFCEFSLVLGKTSCCQLPIHLSTFILSYSQQNHRLPFFVFTKTLKSSRQNNELCSGDIPMTPETDDKIYLEKTIVGTTYVQCSFSSEKCVRVPSIQVLRRKLKRSNVCCVHIKRTFFHCDACCLLVKISFINTWVTHKINSMEYYLISKHAKI